MTKMKIFDKGKIVHIGAGANGANVNIIGDDELLLALAHLTPVQIREIFIKLFGKEYKKHLPQNHKSVVIST